MSETSELQLVNERRLATLENQITTTFSMFKEIKDGIDKVDSNLSNYVKENEEKIEKMRKEDLAKIEKQFVDMNERWEKIGWVEFLSEHPKLALICGAALYLLSISDMRVLIIRFFLNF